MLKVVLLVDDCADVRQVFKEMLEFCCDCTVVEACTGLEAVAAARACRPHLILTDIAMPELDGIEAVRRIRALPDSSAIPIVVITAQPDCQSKNALAAGCSKVLNKPLDLQVLTGVVNEYLSVSH